MRGNVQANVFLQHGKNQHEHGLFFLAEKLVEGQIGNVVYRCEEMRQSGEG
jgi:hypothetical protein